MAKQIGLNTWLNRTTNSFLKEISSGGMTMRFPGLLFDDGAGQPISNVEWIHAPDISAVVGFAERYWVVTGDVVSLMDQASRDALDAAAEQAAIESVVSGLDAAPEHDLLRAVSAQMVFYINQLRNAHLQAPISGAEFRAAVKARL